MIAVPWYLFSLGISIFIVGLLLGGKSKPPAIDRRVIDSSMDDQEIIEGLHSERQIGLPDLVIGLGLLCILVSLVWRLLRFVF